MIFDNLTNIFVRSLRLPEAVYADNQDMLGEVFVPSVDTVSHVMISFLNQLMEFKSFNHFSCSVLNSNVFLSQIRTRNLMEFASFSGLNVLLVGANGSGKTKLIEEFIDYMERLGMSDRVWWMNMFNCLSSILVVEAQFWKKHVYLIMTGMLTFIKKKSASKFDMLGLPGQELLWEWQNSTRAQVAYSFDFFFRPSGCSVEETGILRSLHGQTATVIPRVQHLPQTR